MGPGSSTSPTTRSSPAPAARTPERAVADGLALVEAGFDLLDVGAVAARSGPPVDPGHEAARLVPAVRRLAAESGVPVLADTFSPEVARRALDAGAAAINDIGGGSDEMLELVAERGCGYVLMHIEGPPRVDRPRAVARRSGRAPARPGSRAGSSERPSSGSTASRSPSTPASTST